jgi:hypothetical protein
MTQWMPARLSFSMGPRRGSMLKKRTAALTWRRSAIRVVYLWFSTLTPSHAFVGRRMLEQTSTRRSDLLVRIWN